MSCRRRSPKAGWAKECGPDVVTFWTVSSLTRLVFWLIVLVHVRVCTQCFRIETLRFRIGPVSLRTGVAAGVVSGRACA